MVARDGFTRGWTPVPESVKQALREAMEDVIALRRDGGRNDNTIADACYEAAFININASQFCHHPGCEFCACTWSGVPYCFNHAMKRIGEDEMKRRYEATHDITWAEFMQG